MDMGIQIGPAGRATSLLGERAGLLSLKLRPWELGMPENAGLGVPRPSDGYDSTQLDGPAWLCSLGLCLLDFVTQEDVKVGDRPGPFAVLTPSRCRWGVELVLVIEAVTGFLKNNL